MNQILKPKYWNELKSRLRIKYPQLTDEYMQHKEGLEDNMLQIVGFKLRKTKQEMQDRILKIDFFTYEK